MPNGIKSHSWVTQVKIVDANTVEISIEVDAFASGEYVEVSGCATQTSYDTQSDGGFATFSEIQKIGIPKTGKTPELKVRAKLTKKFQQGQDVIVVARVAKVWITVLSEKKRLPSGVEPQKAGRGWAWSRVEGVGGPDEYSSATEK